HARLHRVHRAFGDRRDLFVRVAVKVRELDDRPLLRRQLPHRMREQVLEIELGRGFDARRERFITVRAGRAETVGPAAALLEELQALAIADPHDPRAYARPAREGARVAPGDQHRVVHAFLGELELTGDPVDEAQQRVVVAGVERAERLAVPVGDPREQGRVGGVLIVAFGGYRTVGLFEHAAALNLHLARVY